MTGVDVVAGPGPGQLTRHLIRVWDVSPRRETVPSEHNHHSMTAPCQVNTTTTTRNRRKTTLFSVIRAAMASSSASALAARLRSHTAALPPALQNNPRTIAALAVALALSLPTASYALGSYRGYLALGPGGMPYNPLGWAIQGLLQLIARWDTRATAPFRDPAKQKPYAPHGTTPFLPAARRSASSSPLPRRAGDRPDVPGYVAPQRQVTQQGGEDMRERMTAFLGALAARNPGFLTIKPSGLEGVGTPALWLDREGPAAAEPPAYLRGTKGELAHVHPEASSHVTVSLADAEELVRLGWAERHRLSGVAGTGIPLGYVMVYAPRDEAELGVWKAAVRAGLLFVAAGAGREVVVDVE